MQSYRKQYYFGSYGLIRGYGPLCRTSQDADASVVEDQRIQQANGGATDRNTVAVSRDTGLCWWFVDDDIRETELVPMRTATGAQVRYSMDTIRGYEGLWGSLNEMAGFG